MQRILILFLLWVPSSFSCMADEPYSCDSIPPKLLENANAVIRHREMTLNIRSAGKAVMTMTFAITILKENAVDKAIFLAGYDAFSRIRHLKGTVYDRNGKRVEKMNSDEFYDFSAIPGYTTYQDFRGITCKPKYQTVPFTVEYSYETDYNGIFDYPDFYLYDDFNVSTVRATLNITVPDSIGIRYFLRNLSFGCKKAKTDSVDTYSWEFRDIPSLHEEPFSPSARELTPSVLIAPHSFRIKGRWGSADTWQSFGLWIYNLNKDRDGLPEETCRKIRELTSGVDETVEKIRKIYQYMQEKTRYVSIQIGIGGWQTALASEVDKLGYGDCKALSNYMMSLLKCAGIRSYCTLACAGEDEPDIVTEFPSQQFNHVILCVPLEKDTIWLECTNQKIPMGFLGTFTDNRPVLVITENGGFLCRTPVYDQKTNIRERSGRMEMDRDGNAKMFVSTRYHGLFYDKYLRVMDCDAADRKKWIVERIPANSFVLDNFSLKEEHPGFAGIEETLELSLKNVAVQAGKFMLLMPNQISREEALSSQTIMRRNPVEVKRAISKTDTILLALPEGLTVTGNPLSQTVTSKYGEYRAKTETDGKTLRYTRNLVIYQGCYPKESCDDFLTFFEKVANADSKKIGLEAAPKQ